MRGHEHRSVVEFNGLFSRGRDEACPVDHFIDCLNVEYIHGGVKTRQGAAVFHSVAEGVVRLAVYKRVDEAPRLLILTANGKIYDSLYLANGPILTIPGMTDFSVISLYNRAYISPHDGVRGLAGQKLYVYSGGGPSNPPRAAGGTKPNGFTLTVTTSGLSGKIEAGQRLYAVAYETDSGFITKPGPDAFTSYTAPGGKKATIGAIPVGPSGTVARWVLSSKRVIGAYSGNQNDYEMFFVDRIADNSTTSLLVDYYDADLVSSADYLLDQLDEIPACVAMCDYRGRLVTVGENTRSSVARVSKAGEPESFSDIDGFIICNPGDAADGLKNCVEFRGDLKLIKSRKAYTSRDNGNVPSSWEAIPMDGAIGTEPHGVARILDDQTGLTNYIIIADRSGLYGFDGAFSNIPLSFKIHNIWGRINLAAFKYVEVAIDSISKRIFIVVPLDGATYPNYIIYGDYSNGMDAQNIKWALWKAPVDYSCCLVDVDNTTKKPYLVYGNRTADIYKQTTALLDVATAIETYVTFPPLAFTDDDGQCVFSAVRILAYGDGNLEVRYRNLAATRTVDALTLTLTSTPTFLQRLINLVSERCVIRLRLNIASKYFVLTKFILYGKKVGESAAR